MPAPASLARWARWVLILFFASLLLAVYAPGPTTTATQRGTGYAVLHHVPRRVGGHSGLAASATPRLAVVRLDLSRPSTLPSTVHISASVL